MVLYIHTLLSAFICQLLPITFQPNKAVITKHKRFYGQAHNISAKQGSQCKA
jgi:hypothetical protein